MNSSDLFGYCMLFWLFIFTPVSLYWCLFRDGRASPAGYIGKFRRGDGTIVHVSRLPDRTLMVISEERPGVMPRDLGTVTGRELAAWQKLASTPDGGR